MQDLGYRTEKPTKIEKKIKQNEQLFQNICQFKSELCVSQKKHIWMQDFSMLSQQIHGDAKIKGRRIDWTIIF